MGSCGTLLELWQCRADPESGVEHAGEAAPESFGGGEEAVVETTETGPGDVAVARIRISCPQ